MAQSDIAPRVIQVWESISVNMQMLFEKFKGLKTSFNPKWIAKKSIDYFLAPD